MSKKYIFITFIFIFISVNAFSNSKIYLIRHAKVPIENSGWCSSQIANEYKVLYNNTSVQKFDSEMVLKKIDRYETIDTVFCSPQLRAKQTAELLFGKNVNLKINENLMELDYPVIKWPLLKLPVKVWLTTSLIAWMAGNNQDKELTYKQRKDYLENYSLTLIAYAETHGETVIVAHGVVIREIIKILKKKGWTFEDKDGYGNLSVNCLVNS